MRWAYKTLFVDPGALDISDDASDAVRDMIKSVLILHTPPMERDLNDLGSEGWELVAVVPCVIDGAQRAVAIFKRPA
jgi:hypothetical protein